MSRNISEDETDDILYFARVGETSDLKAAITTLTARENCSVSDLISFVKDEFTGNGVLHMAAANGHLETLSQILTVLSTPPQNPILLALLNAQNLSGNTCLHYACLNGHLEIVKLILEHGGDPTVTNARGHDPVYEAELNDKKDVVEWVLKEGGEELMSGFGEVDGEGTGRGEGSDAEDEMDVGEEGERVKDGEESALGDELKEKLESLGFKEEGTGS